MHAIKYASKAVTAGIGVASEAVAEVKNRRKSSVDQQNDHLEGAEKDGKEDDESDMEIDEEEWTLDEAAAEFQGLELQESEDEKLGPDADDKIAASFFANHNIPKAGETHTRLSQPVILPQRRPKSAARGFIRAYAPVLESAGIDQQLFMDFLNTFDKASKASPVFDVVNLAALGIGLIPSPITGLTMGVSIAIQFASNTGKELQQRVRRNTYLDTVNRELFMPRGLYCMIMAFKPDNPYDPVLGLNINATSSNGALTAADATPNGDQYAASETLVKELSPTQAPKVRSRMKNLRLNAGTTSGEASLPEGAPLVYPALETADGTPLGKKGSNGIRTTPAFLDSYLDRRAQARWAAQHPDSQLAGMNPPSEKKFVNRFSDPNHPIHSGTIIGPLTGGRWDPVADLRAKHAIWRARRKGVELSEAEIWNARMGRSTATGVVGRILQQDVLYMIVTNLPTEAEMKAANESLEEVKARGGIAQPK
ncbi:hypothetical protein PV11_10022 [Exophiala sideris]|uniref:Uncharacterized protein n=1 Tax=Exophiala sideris TaxID=1016849 RepID=A0A0D1YTR6_9EURO|nr:hypothetical protein PV11_10022 [Exophiala sideris]